MKVAIVGSRDWPDLQMVIDYVNQLPNGTKVISGGARGVDTVAVDAAKARGLETLVFLASWDTHGKSAGYRRNVDIVNAADEVVAFLHNESKGTNHTISITKSQGKSLTVIRSQGE